MATTRYGEILADLLALRACKGMDSRGRLLLEGVRMVLSARRAGVALDALAYAPEHGGDAPAAQQLMAALEREGVPRARLSARDFSRISYKADGVIAVVRPAWPTLDEVLRRSGLVVALDAPSDPGNVGAVIRTANAWGAAGVVVLGDAEKITHPKCLRASTGALFHTPTCAATRDELLARALGRRLVVLVPDGDRAWRADERAIVVLGNEKRGVHPELVRAASERVAIPMTGVVDSLNVSNAAAVILWDAFRARSTP
ncbi:TrmH family RNA methyltransferase [Sandaracinus amylolyticus]|uniref:RNA methyltransferase, TrmH family n=1 Tax=Sandaracinus amylolyticus TaxID=927083 RepID=A0A0F6SHF4_9BACT|nr:RNA methyltransferase [Sandaracinus amylolyticus]AKF10349.1 RNA methyltransferase, TrmH family [Sandaracinus amylolyticus]